MIDTSKAIPITRAAKLVPSQTRPDRPVCTATVHRWITYGVHGVKLEAVSVGGKWATTPEALDRFFRAVTERRLAAKGGGGGGTVMTTEADRRMRHRQGETERELDALGVV